MGLICHIPINLTKKRKKLMKKLTKKQLTTLRKIFWIPHNFYAGLIYIVVMSWIVPHIVYSLFGINIDLLVMLYLLVAIVVENVDFKTGK